MFGLKGAYFYFIALQITFIKFIKKIYFSTDFYNKSLKDSDIKKLMSGEKLSKKMIELDWDPSKMKTSKIVQKGPIRIQSDLSKIRYSNIWLQPLDE